MSDFESKIDINIDAGKALAAIKTLQRQISDFHTSLAKGSATANIKSLQMQQTLIDTINATGQYSAQMKTVASATQTFTTALEKNKLSMGQYFRYAGGASKSFGRFFKSEMDTIQKVAIERVKDLQTQYIKMGRDANGAIRSIAVRPLALDMENLATKTQIAAQKQQLLNQLLKQGSTNLLNFGKNTQWAGRQLMVGFTIPLGILGTTAAKTFMQMEEQAIKFKRVYGDTFTASKETDAMLKQVQALASEFTKYGVAVEKTMEQAATAAAAGKQGADLLAQVSEATRLSVLGNVEQQKALETTISLTNAFGTATDELRGKINFLNAVENQTVTSIEDLTTAIPKAAPVIKQLGGNVEDLTFFLTAMREGGINASEGANALKSGLASLINPTKKASDFLQGFGININKIVEGNKGDVKGLVVDFAKALDTLDPLNRARAIEQLFGKFQFSRLSTLFQNVIKDGSQAARVLELTKQSSAELGILAQRELNRISASPMYKFQKAIADFKKELAPVGEEFLKAVTPIIQFGTDMLKAFNNLDGGVKQFIVNATGLIAGIGPVFLMTFGLLANGVANIIKGFTFVKTVFNKASTASTILGETTDYMTQQQLEAAAVAASLEQVHNKLTQAFTVEKGAVDALTSSYQKAISAQVAFSGASAGGKTKVAPKKYATGIVSVPGPKGAGDIIPAMLSPGEAVIPAKIATKYSGFISGMIAGKIPGFNKGKVGGSNPTPKPPRKPKTLADAISKIASDQPKFYTDQTKDLLHPDFPNEQQIVREAFAAQGFDIDGKDSTYQTYIQPHAAHTGVEGSSRAVTVDTKGGKFSRWIKNWAAKFITPQLGVMNKYMQDISHPDIEALANDPKQKGKKVVIYRKFMNEDNIKRVAKALKIPVAEVRKHAAHLFAGNEALTPQQTAVLGKIAETHRDNVKITDRMGKIARRKAKAEIAKTEAVSRVASRRVSMANDPAGFFLGRGKYKENESKRTAYEKVQEQRLQAAANKATATEIKARNDQTAASVATSKAAKAKTATAKKEEKEIKKPKPRTRKPVAKPATATQAVSATPTIKVTEQLANGITRTVNEKGQERYYQKGRSGSLSAAEARNILAGSGAAATPKGRIRGLLTGLPGKLGLAGLATMGAGAVSGNEQVSSLSDKLFQAAMLASFIPQGTMGKIKNKLSPITERLGNTKIGGAIKARYGAGGIAQTALSTFKEKAALSIASKGFMKSVPMLIAGLARVGTKFIPVIGQILLVLDIAFNLLTINARKQEDISKSIVDTLSMTKERLDKVNEFFGTDAKLSGLRTATLGFGAAVGEKQSLAEQFRQSEQFGALYKDQAEKLKDASDKQFAITMQALGIDLMGQGVGEEQVQIIIDAIKKEAGKQNVVINFKDLRIDTETGRKNLAKSLREITKDAIKEYESNRNFLGFNFEATAKLDELGAQVAGFLSGLSQEFVNGKISVEEFNSSFADIAETARKVDAAHPGDGILFLKETMMATNPELAAGMTAIADYPTYLLAMNAAAKGAALSFELLADAASSIPEIQNKAKEYLEDLNDFQDEKNRDIQKQQKLIAGLTTQQKNLQKQEESINDTYDKRIKALERINDLQEQISKQKQNELDLADALSKGDIGAAARIVQQIRADQASLALQQQKNALEDQRDKKTGSLQDKQDALSGQIDNANTELQNIMNRQEPAYKPSKNAKLFTAAIDKMWSTFGWIWNLTHFWLPEAEKKSSFYQAAGDQIKAVYQMFPGLFPTGKASGGHITGPGSGTSDSIPAMLSNGEYVIRANAVKAIGTDTLDKLNYADKFAKGGLVQRFSEGGQPDPEPYKEPRRVSRDRRLRQAAIANQTRSSFASAAQRLLNLSQSPKYANTSFGYKLVREALALKAYGEVLARNEKYSFVSPKVSGLKSSAMFDIDKMTIPQLLQLSKSIRNPAATSSAPFTQIVTKNQNYRVAHYNPIADWMYRTGIYTPKSMRLASNTVANETTSQSLRPMGPYPHIMTGAKNKFNSSYVTTADKSPQAFWKNFKSDRHLVSLATKFPSLHKPLMSFMEKRQKRISLSSRIANRLSGRINPNNYLNQFARYGMYPDSVRSGLMNIRDNFKNQSGFVGPLSTYMQYPGRRDGLWVHEGQHITDKWKASLLASSGYKDYTLNRVGSGVAYSNAVNEATARAAEKMAFPNTSYRPYNHPFMYSAGKDGKFNISKSSPADTVAQSLVNLANSGYSRQYIPIEIKDASGRTVSSTTGPRYYQISSQWFSDYASTTRSQSKAMGLTLHSRGEYLAHKNIAKGLKEAGLSGLSSPTDFISFLRVQSAKAATAGDQNKAVKYANAAEILTQQHILQQKPQSKTARTMAKVSSGVKGTMTKVSSGVKRISKLFKDKAYSIRYNGAIRPPEASPLRSQPSIKGSGGSSSSTLPAYGWSGSTQKTRVGNYAKGGLVKRDVTSFDPGINWINQFIQNLLGGGNPSAFMQNDSTKALLSQSYVQGAKNMGVDPTDPMFYASMFAPSMGLKSLGMAGKGLSKLKGLSSSKPSIPTTMTGFKNYLPDAYVNFMRSNPKIAIRMQSKRFMDKLSKGDFEYRNAHSSRDLDSMSKAERGDFLDVLRERADIEENVFGIRPDAPGSARPIYGAAVDTRVPWGIRGKQENDLQSAMSILRGKYSNVSSTNFDRYGDMSLILKNRVKKRSTFTLGDTYSQKNFDGFNGYPGQEWDGYKAAIPAPFGTKSRSQILAADSEVTKNELRFVEAQIFGGLPFSDVKRIIVRNPELIAPLRKSIAQAGLRIPVGESKLSPLGKFIKMLNLKDKSTGLPSFYVPFNEPYKIPKFKNGGMFRTPYAQGGLAMLHDKEFVMNAGAVKDYGLNNLKAMNNGTYNGGSVYNSYGVNISVGGSNSNANDIARTVIREIKRLDSQNIRSTKV